ncbi:MAG: alpha/beta fold hydrolase [Burkholderiales bacterium]
MRLISASAFFLLIGCALVEGPRERTASIAAQANFRPVELPDARMVGFSRGTKATRLTIYIESDGAAWPWPDTPPADPTPVVPRVLRMAVIDRSEAVAYLGRPCQHLKVERLLECDPALWTQARFSEAAVAMTNAAVETLRHRHGATRLDLVGYSGGGAMAALVAARRNDVDCLVTLAAPLDTDAWTTAKRVSPLSGSLNPANIPVRAAVRQTHVRGGRDEVVPYSTTSRYLARTPSAHVLDMPSFGHDCCWDRDWPTLRERTCLAS